VGSLLGQNFSETPWTADELEISLENVRKLSRDYLAKAQDKLAFIKKLSPPMNDKAEESYESLENLLKFLGQRNV
jgi:hypothetical protein